MRFLPVGPQCILVELADLDATLALFDALLADPVIGIAEIVPAARTLMVTTTAGVPADKHLAAAIAQREPKAGTVPVARSTETVDIPVIYDGEDLDDISRLMGLSTAEVVAAHQDSLWQVAFCGFAPGFAYMTCGDDRFDLPRRPAPRTKIPAGSVALAGRFCGIYPQETPGGWQLLGRTEVPMFDLSRDPSALLRPGVRAQFVKGQGKSYPVKTPTVIKVSAGLRVIQTAFPILVQDAGRFGQAGQGVSSSGALDLGALRRANRAVGNPANDPALEITLGPVRLRADRSMTLALSGAAQAIVIHPQGRHVIEHGAAFALDANDEVLIDSPAQGMRSYLSIRGGFDIPPVLGSHSTDTLAHIGPAALTSGDAVAPAGRPAFAIADRMTAPDLPAAEDVVVLPVTLGPRTDWFSPEMIARFLEQEWQVTAQSSRVGIRLSGNALSRDGTELPSEGTATGAIQIPHSGQPVLFLADHPLTGGYPVIATVHPKALDLAGQIPPGARIRFVAEDPFAPITLEGRQ
ncbi:carboxyltransferase domain-containing protein [Paracoccus sp. JM45]|uniref:5-oxoprolinase subunit B/C family protein n=1 Tax=Paracoccus sp. JM45 TaxID=2283626 RepID=UPI000E6C502B|nr:carboxyltransferase domain-containing protein [Paracoccus sp. JM45]RJE78811.1 allophanate hydrolase [Paracoccus sp. JM45]